MKAIGAILAFFVVSLTGCTSGNSYQPFRGEILHVRVTFNELMALLVNEGVASNPSPDILDLRDAQLLAHPITRFYSQSVTNQLLLINPDSELWQRYAGKDVAATQESSQETGNIAVCSPVPFVATQGDQPSFVALTFEEQVVLIATLPAWTSNQISGPTPQFRKALAKDLQSLRRLKDSPPFKTSGSNR